MVAILLAIAIVHQLYLMSAKSVLKKFKQSKFKREISDYKNLISQ